VEVGVDERVLVKVIVGVPRGVEEAVGAGLLRTEGT